MALRIIMSVVVAAMLAGCMRGPVDGSWPARNINIIVPVKPGGGFGLQARLLAPFLRQYLADSVNVVIDNVDGAGCTMGAVRLPRSGPAGSTSAWRGAASV